MNSLRVSPLKPLAFASRAQSFIFNCCVVAFFCFVAVADGVVLPAAAPGVVTPAGGVMPLGCVAVSLGCGRQRERHHRGETDGDQQAFHRFLPVAFVKSRSKLEKAISPGGHISFFGAAAARCSPRQCRTGNSVPGMRRRPLFFQT
jgi:hypothetical protein